jgi:hypothetical protein
VLPGTWKERSNEPAAEITHFDPREHWFLCDGTGRGIQGLLAAKIAYFNYQCFSTIRRQCTRFFASSLRSISTHPNVVCRSWMPASMRVHASRPPDDPALVLSQDIDMGAECVSNAPSAIERSGARVFWKGQEIAAKPASFCRSDEKTGHLNVVGSSCG